MRIDNLRLLKIHAFNSGARMIGPEKTRAAMRLGSHRPFSAGHVMSGYVAMLPCGNMSGSATRIVCVLIAVLSLLGSMGTDAQAWQVGPQGEQARLVSPADALDTFAQVQEWINAGQTPTDADLPNGSIGVWVGVRWAGRLVGSAQEIDATNLRRPSSRALTGSVRRAWSQARNRARGNGDAIMQSDREIQFESSPRRTVEIDLAFNPIRIRATSLDSVVSRIKPGLDGLLMRSAGESYAVFPAEMLAQDQTTASAVLGLLARADADMQTIGAQIADGRLRLWTFQTWHIAQDQRDGPPIFLTRGTRTVPQESIDTRAVRLCTTQAAQYLERNTFPWRAPAGEGDVSGRTDPRAQPGKDGPLILLGPYRPWVDQHGGAGATSYEQALAVLALGRFGQDVADTDEQRERARTTASRLFSGLAVDVPEQIRPLADDRTTALIVVVWNEFPFLRGHKTTDDLFREALTRLALLYHDGSGYAPGLSPETRALVALALGSRSAVDAAWNSTDTIVQAMLSPWIGWAELALSDGSATSSGRAMLRALRERSWTSQIGTDPLSDAGEDEVGGLIFRPGAGPGWETARLSTLLASMLGDSVLTPDGQRFNEILSLQATMRFLRQLQIREADRYRVRVMSSALGGVRLGLTSQQVSPEATAMTVLAGSEFLRSLDHLSAPEMSVGAGGER